MSNAVTLAEEILRALGLEPICNYDLVALAPVLESHDADVRRKERSEINDWVVARAMASEITIDDSVIETEARINVAMTLAEDRARREALEDAWTIANREDDGFTAFHIRSLIDKKQQ